MVGTGFAGSNVNLSADSFFGATVESEPSPRRELAAAVRMDVVARRLHFWRRPVGELLVFVFAHDEDVDGLVGGEFVLNSLEEEVVPVDEDLAWREFDGVVAEFDVADFAAEAGVAADLNQEFLAVARGVVAAVGFDAHVIAERAVEEDVVPAADVECGDLDVGEVLFDGPLLPVGVVGRMREPVEIIRCDCARDRGAGGELFVIEGGEVGEGKRRRCRRGRWCLFRFGATSCWWRVASSSFDRTIARARRRGKSSSRGSCWR